MVISAVTNADARFSIVPDGVRIMGKLDEVLEPQVLKSGSKHGGALRVADSSLIQQTPTLGWTPLTVFHFCFLRLFVLFD